MQLDHRATPNQQQQQQQQQQQHNKYETTTTAEDPRTCSEHEGINDTNWQDDRACTQIRVDSQTLQELICGHAINIGPLFTPALKRITQTLDTWPKMNRINKPQTADPCNGQYETTTKRPARFAISY